MARTPKNYAVDTQLSTSATDIVPAAPSNTTSNVRKMSFFNSSSSTNRLVTIHVVEASGTADTGNTIIEKSIPPRKTWNVIELQGETLEAGMKVQATQDAGTDVNANCSGYDIT